MSKAVGGMKKKAVALDVKHRMFLEQFKEEDDSILPSLYEQYTSYANLLENNINDDNGVGKNKLSLQQQFLIKENMDKIIQKIKKIKGTRRSYYLDNMKYVCQYYDRERDISQATGGEGNVDISPDNDLMSADKKLFHSSRRASSVQPKKTKKTKLVDAIFNCGETEVDKDREETEFKADNEGNGGLLNNPVVQYFSNIDKSYVPIATNAISNEDICTYCRNGELSTLEDEGMLICNSCYSCVPYLIDNEKPSYKEPPKEMCFYAYKRVNHFKEILAQFQGKETTNIPEKVFNDLERQIKKERIVPSQLTYATTKNILRKMGHCKYYEHIAFINNKKFGIKPPLFSPELEETLINLFIELQAPYAKYRPEDRVNFLNYYYTLYKLCELLGETQYLSKIPMLKDHDKKNEQDTVWRNICKDKGWQFMPTVDYMGDYYDDFSGQNWWSAVTGGLITGTGEQEKGKGEEGEG